MAPSRPDKQTTCAVDVRAGRCQFGAGVVGGERGLARANCRARMEAAEREDGSVGRAKVGDTGSVWETLSSPSGIWKAIALLSPSTSREEQHSAHDHDWNTDHKPYRHAWSLGGMS